MLTLEVTPPEGRPYEVVVDADSVVVGRATSCAVTIADRYLSRRHARIFRDGERWLVEDLGSRNATLLNGAEVVAPTEVRPGDVLSLSSSEVAIVGERRPSADGGVGGPSPAESFYRLASEVLRDSKSAPPGAEAPPEALARYAERLAMVNQVHQVLAQPINLADLLELILERAFHHLRPEQGAVFLRDQEGGFDRAAQRSRPGLDAADLPFSDAVAHEVVDKGMAALVFDTLEDQRFAASKSLIGAGIRCLVAAPLLGPEGALGLIVLCSNAAVRQFDEEDLELLVTLAAVAAMRIRNLLLAEESAERQRLERELELARRIQTTLLPDTLPELEGYELHATNIPSRGVSGDYYEVLERSGGSECVLALADVSGKGIAASLLTGYLEALAATPIEDGLPPDEVFNRVSDRLYRRTPSNKFATMFLAALEPTSGRVRFANAGHTPALVVRTSGATRWLEATGVPLGLLPGSTYTGGEATLAPGDSLILYSDGITEAESSAEEEYGEERLEAVCVAHAGAPPAVLAAAIGADLERFVGGQPYADDRTLVILRRVGE